MITRDLLLCGTKFVGAASKEIINDVSIIIKLTTNLSKLLSILGPLLTSITISYYKHKLIITTFNIVLLTLSREFRSLCQPAPPRPPPAF